MELHGWSASEKVNLVFVTSAGSAFLSANRDYVIAILMEVGT